MNSLHLKLLTTRIVLYFYNCFNTESAQDDSNIEPRQTRLKTKLVNPDAASLQIERTEQTEQVCIPYEYLMCKYANRLLRTADNVVNCVCLCTPNVL